MGGSRVFIGRLPRGCRERDVEEFFRRCGRIRNVILKRGYAFVDFRDDRDAADAVYDMNGRTLRGERMTVEIASGRPRGRGREQTYRTQRRSDSAEKGSSYKMIINNLSSRINWKNLKDMIREEDIDVVNVEAHKEHKNQGTVIFRSLKDLERAVKKFKDRELEGRKLEIVVPKNGSRDRSLSDERRHQNKRKRSGSRSSSRSRSGSVKKSATLSPPVSPKRSRGDSNRKLSRSPSERRRKSPPHHRDSSRSVSRSPPPQNRARSASSSPPPHRENNKKYRSPSLTPPPKGGYDSSSPTSPTNRQSSKY